MVQGESTKKNTKNQKAGHTARRLKPQDYSSKPSCHLGTESEADAAGDGTGKVYTDCGTIRSRRECLWCQMEAPGTASFSEGRQRGASDDNVCVRRGRVGTQIAERLIFSAFACPNLPLISRCNWSKKLRRDALQSNLCSAWDHDHVYSTIKNEDGQVQNIKRRRGMGFTKKVTGEWGCEHKLLSQGDTEIDG